MTRKKVVASDYQSKEFESYFQQKRPEMLKYVPQKASSILDVGCSSGGFGQLLKTERSVEVWGVELNEQAAEIAAQRIDRVICAAFDSNLDLPSQYFDCIIFNDVLEHLVDPFSALLYSKELLRNGGVVVTSIPNVRFFGNIWKLLVHKDWKYTDQGILDRTHLRFFTYRSILETFEALGYCVDDIEGINPIDERHPQHLLKFNLLNLLLFKNIEDMRYVQFAVVAHPIIT
jgi:2-polyprenyl-3-methyl-5-hydroxy-6-metoxy-1,4-benzoquinol methylase